MAGSERPPPLITVVVPGRETPAEVLESGPRAPPPPVPARLRALLLAVVAVLTVGVLVALDRQEPVRPPPVAADDAPGVPGVTAQVGLVAEEPYSTLLDVAVTIAPGHDPDGSAVQPAPELKLVDVAGHGLTVRLLRGSPPLLLGYLGRFAAARERVLHLTAEAVVADCHPGAASPAILLLVQHEDALGAIRAQGDPSATRALASLVRRTCRLAGG